ncbi:glycerol-3-phosphate dehydrogenase [NAD(P)+] [Litorimonas cladophorae]|uniref:Glycerol-3-phosphate dehydrogenase [NAD(P)+] n=1 Tax=Litorimonas cladophorae TaxID=1220491 RepID=A0A918NKE2_9PROT|nr:NAD(P)H-dependent glycerol-3-phosphate dehydrogenase [Litorimonas cladophorae]GGX74911.1 glycerol-3-phosphate dehydrogenase [NAD(P)+] [Litorimonas cladophorae]
MPKYHAIVLGAGSWGTALAQLLAANGHAVTLWMRDADQAADINATRQNARYLPDANLHEGITATADIPNFAQADLCLSVIPAQHTRAQLLRFASYILDGLPIVLCSKGIEISTLEFMNEVLAETVPQAARFVLSGPSFARDVVKGLPTAVTLAGDDLAAANALAPLVQGPTFRPYTTDDMIGAEIGGAVKNVLAIACGMLLGMGLGQSAHAALIARGFAEMNRLGAALGARTETLSGLCGLGDLVLTCSSTQSRNMSCGMRLGEGEALQDILSSRNSVTEGVATAPALVRLAAKHDVDMPICIAVDRVLSGNITPAEAMAELLTRPLKSETD